MNRFLSLVASLCLAVITPIMSQASETVVETRPMMSPTPSLTMNIATLENEQIEMLMVSVAYGVITVDDPEEEEPERCEGDPGSHPEALPSIYLIVGYEANCPGTNSPPAVNQCILDLQADISYYIVGADNMFRDLSCQCYVDHLYNPVDLEECLAERRANCEQAIQDLVDYYMGRYLNCCPATP